MELKPKKPEICDAIKNKQQIEFTYNGKPRRGNPQCYGINRTGKEALRVHLIEGGSRPEQMFLLDNMELFKVLKVSFIKPGPNYKKGDKDMIHIFCEL